MFVSEREEGGEDEDVNLAHPAWFMHEPNRIKKWTGISRWHGVGRDLGGARAEEGPRLIVLIQLAMLRGG